jgi:formate dehydrogenase maturation protein FdhE
MEVLLHGHHEGLLTWGRGYEERLAEVRSFKAAHELPTRERLMRVLTEAELAALPPALLAAGLAYDEAGRAYVEAWRAWDEAWRAWVEAMRDHGAAIEEWHKVVCPGCLATPENNWNIFGEDK